MASLVPNAAWSGAESPIPPTACGPHGTGDGASLRHATARSRSTGGKREIWRVVRSYIHDRRCRSDKTLRFHIIYVSANAVAPGRSRRKESIIAIRHVVLDLDDDGARILFELSKRRDLPQPSYVLHTSHDHFHVLWRVCGFTSELVEEVQKSLALDLGTDSAATACSQMTRLPGFVNYKHDTPHLVRAHYARSHGVFTPQDFPKPRGILSANVRATRPALLARPSGPQPLERARRFLARTSPAIAGQHGDLWTFRIPNQGSSGLVGLLPGPKW
jgi:hypothetical protein